MSFTIYGHSGAEEAPAWVTWHGPGRATYSDEGAHLAVAASLASDKPIDRPCGISRRTLDEAGSAYLVIRVALEPVEREEGAIPNLGPSNCVVLPGDPDY